MPNTFDARKWFLISTSVAIIIIAIAVSSWFFVGELTALTDGKTNKSSNNSSYSNNFTVSATQKVIVDPEIMIIQATVDSSGDDLPTTLQSHLKKVADLNQFFQSQGIVASDVERGRVDLSSDSDSYYDDEVGGRVYDTAIPTQYIDQTLTITLRDFSKFTSIAKRLKGDKIEITGTTFSVVDFDQKIQVARIQAFANAKEKAEKLAIAAGVELGEILTIRDDSQNYDEDSPSSEVRVSLTYKIK